MHPTRKKIIDLISGQIKSSDEISEIEKHIEQCEFCSDIYQEYISIKDLELETDCKISDEAIQSRDRLFVDSINTKTIVLNILSVDRPKPVPATLAADGQEKTKPELENIATLFSENPELVLKVMRDNKSNRDFIQLLSNEKIIVSHVLIKIPDTETELVTDSNGRAYFKTQLDDNISPDKWQVKLPDADFKLNLLDYDPEAVEYQKEMHLETENQDSIKVTFQKKTEGGQINIGIEKLAGRSDLKDLRIIVSQKDKAVVKSVSSNDTVTFKLAAIHDEINIRLYE